MIKALLGTEDRTMIERWIRDRARAVPMPSGKTLCRALGEYPMVVDLEDLSVAPHLAFDGFWELWLAIRMARGVKSDWNAIDVGANAGFFTVLLAALTGGAIEAWEPMSDLTAMLGSTLRMNGLTKRVAVHTLAAGAAPGQLDLYRDQQDYGSASLNPAEEAARGALAHPVKVARLDQKTTLSRVDFIKIDAEGYEPEVWAGMTGILKRGEPRAMLMEFTPSRYGDPKGFLDSIAREGFRISIVDHAGGLQKIVGDVTTISEHVDLWLER